MPDFSHRMQDFAHPPSPMASAEDETLSTAETQRFPSPTPIWKIHAAGFLAKAQRAAKTQRI